MNKNSSSEKLNQELTRQNIINLRKERNFTQGELARKAYISRTTYNGIENGKVKITPFYVLRLAQFYGVPFDKIAVLANSFDEGFYQGMQVKEKMLKSEFDSMSMKIYQTGKEILSGKKYTSTLYPALKAMGYNLEVMDLEDCDPVKIPPEVKESSDEGKIFVLKKGNKIVGYWSPSDFYNFERYIATSIKGYINDIAYAAMKADENESDMVIQFKGSQKITFHKKNSLFKLRKSKNSNSKFKRTNIISDSERFSSQKQLKELENNLELYGVTGYKDDEDEE